MLAGILAETPARILAETPAGIPARILAKTPAGIPAEQIQFTDILDSSLAAIDDSASQTVQSCESKLFSMIALEGDFTNDFPQKSL